jgi:hypothetical protein
VSAEEKGKGVKETIAEESIALAKDVYADAGKPAVQELGQTLGSVTRLLLWPVRKLADGANAALDRLSARVGKKLDERVPPERQIAAPATIAGPAAMRYVLLGEGDEVFQLRDMFENLLAASMDSDTASEVHPAFVEVISQLTSDEAWILKSIDRDRTDYAAVERFVNAERGKRRLGLFTMLGREVVTDARRRAQCISNLVRLGILEVSDDGASDLTEYEPLDKVIEPEVKALAGDGQMWGHAKALRVTPFGVQFLNTCVRVSK